MDFESTIKPELKCVIKRKKRRLKIQ